MSPIGVKMQGWEREAVTDRWQTGM